MRLAQPLNTALRPASGELLAAHSVEGAEERNEHLVPDRRRIRRLPLVNAPVLASRALHGEPLGAYFAFSSDIGGAWMASG